MAVQVVKTKAEARRAVRAAKQGRQIVGLVPTMGALHAGHSSLIRTARTRTDFTAVSIFVNPTQFGPDEDFDRYPRMLQADIDLCSAVGADLVFAPSVEEVFPAGYATYVEVLSYADQLCGPSRPGHFRGVATVVLKLFNMIEPDVAFFGQKDAQQVRIIQKLTSDLDLAVEVVSVPTVREADGLAMSSRNRYLDPVQRANATVLYRSLERVAAAVVGGERDVNRLESILADDVAATPGARLDYGRIVDAATLQPIEKLKHPGLAALAVFFGTTRLIDNILLTPGGRELA